MTTFGTENGASATGNWVTLEGFTDRLDKTEFEGEFVGNFSGLARDPLGRIAALSDRSVLFFLDPETLTPLERIRLRDELRQPIDCEALAFDQDEILVISEKPEIYRFDAAGKLLGVLPVPPRFRVTPVGQARFNEVFEGMTLTPDGGTLIASMENALLTDAPDILRFPTWERVDPDEEFKPAAQYCYRVDSGLLVSDIATTGDGRLFVIERGFDSTGNTIRLYLADLRDARDVNEIEELGPDAPVVPKQLLVDMVDLPPSGAVAKQPQVNPLLGNIEAMTMLDPGPDEQTRLLLVTDDNASESQITRFYTLLVTLPPLT